MGPRSRNAGAPTCARRRRGGPLVAVLLASSLACSGGNGGSGGRATGPASPEPAGRLVFLVPTYLPEGMTVSDGSVDRRKKEPGSYAAVLGRPAGDGFVDILSVNVHSAASDRSVSADERKHITTVRIGRVPARLADYSDVAGAYVDWFQDGLAIAVSGRHGSRDVVLRVARALRIPASGDVTKVRLRSVPPRYEVIAQRALRPFRSDTTRMSLRSADPKRFATAFISVVTMPVRGFLPALLVGRADRLTYGSVRGAKAAIGTQTVNAPVRIQTTSLAWLEYPDVLVAVTAQLPERELKRLAEGLRETTESEWRRQAGA